MTRKFRLVGLAGVALVVVFLGCQSKTGVMGPVPLHDDVWKIDGTVTHLSSSPAVGYVIQAECEDCLELVGPGDTTDGDGYYECVDTEFADHDGDKFHMNWGYFDDEVWVSGQCHTGYFVFNGPSDTHDFTVP